jgi:hypothetical protein
MKKSFLFALLSAAIISLIGCTNPKDLLDDATDDAVAPAADVAAN